MDLRKSQWTRRRFLGKSLQGGMGVTLLGRTSYSQENEIANSQLDLESHSKLDASLDYAFFTEKERILLAGLSEAILPGASAMGAVAYIEMLATAFSYDPPRILAGGPFSGRKPYWQGSEPGSVFPENRFAQFMPLNRVQEKGWRIRIEQLQLMLREGLEKADRLIVGKPEKKSRSTFATVLVLLPKELRTTLKELVLEACFSAPEYGGNKNLEGWKLAHFDGDTAPLGYSTFDPVSEKWFERKDLPLTKRDRINPKPLSLFTKIFLRIITMFQGGRIG